MNDEAKDLMARFYEELKGPTGDGQGKRQNGKPPWYIDPDHHRAMFSHYHKWLKGELVDEDSGKHPFVHMAWRALALACIETGNVPRPVPVESLLDEDDFAVLADEYDDLSRGFQ